MPVAETGDNHRPALELRQGHGAIGEVARTRDEDVRVVQQLDGLDLVVHAATKWLSGHGDAVSGAVTGSAELLRPIRKQVDTLGQAASPFAIARPP